MPSESQLFTLRTQIAPAAVSASRLSGIPAELLCAQAILESAWLTKLAGSNNCFGIKWYPGAPGRELVSTQEWFTDSQADRFLRGMEGRTAVLVQPVQVRGDRRLYRVEDWFASFPVLSACFTRRALMFTEGRYATFARAYRESGDLEAFVRGMAPIYATDPQYAEKVLAIARAPSVVQAVEELELATTGYDKKGA